MMVPERSARFVGVLFYVMVVVVSVTLVATLAGLYLKVSNTQEALQAQAVRNGQISASLKQLSLQIEDLDFVHRCRNEGAHDWIIDTLRSLAKQTGLQVKDFPELPGKAPVCDKRRSP